MLRSRVLPPIFGWLRPREQHAIVESRSPGPVWEPARSLAGAKGEPVATYLSCLPADLRINPTNSASSVYLALLFSPGSLRVHIYAVFCQRKRERERERERQEERERDGSRKEQQATEAERRPEQGMSGTRR